MHGLVPRRSNSVSALCKRVKDQLIHKDLSFVIRTLKSELITLLSYLSIVQRKPMWCFPAGSVGDALPYIHTTYFTLAGNLPQVIYPHAWVIYPYACILYSGNLPPIRGCSDPSPEYILRPVDLCRSYCGDSNGPRDMFGYYPSKSSSFIDPKGRVTTIGISW